MLKTIGYIQHSVVFGNKEANFKKVEELLEDVTADLIVLPELFTTGYTFESKQESLSMAELKDAETSVFLQKMSQKTGAVIVAGYVEKTTDNEVYNSCMMVDETGLLENYRKIHLFNTEKFWYEPGNLEYPVVEIRGMKIGMMICYDWFFPEAARTLALKGADVIAHPCNLVMPYCPDAMVTRCLENRVFAITANRVGDENRAGYHNHFIGKSQITAFNGERLGTSNKLEECVNLVEVDLSKARDKHINENNNVFEERNTEFFKL